MSQNKNRRMRKRRTRMNKKRRGGEEWKKE